MSQTIWKGHLAFGLVTIPVRLVAAARSESISFHMLHRHCGSRLQQKLTCNACNTEVRREDTVKGYEEGRDQYLRVEPSEIEAIAPPSSATMEILQFIAGEELDPIYFDASYYLEPEKVGRTAYKLLAEAMRKSGRLAIVKLALHHREHTVVVRPCGPGLALHTMFYPAEVRALEVNLSDVEIAAEHLTLAEQLIASLVKPFDPGSFRDEYRERLLTLIESKRNGQPLAVPAAAPARPVVNILDALIESLGRKPPVMAETPVPVLETYAAKQASRPRRRAAKPKEMKQCAFSS